MSKDTAQNVAQNGVRKFAAIYSLTMNLSAITALSLAKCNSSHRLSIEITNNSYSPVPSKVQQMQPIAFTN